MNSRGLRILHASRVARVGDGSRPPPTAVALWFVAWEWGSNAPHCLANLRDNRSKS
jgi:hypothetical protein